MQGYVIASICSFLFQNAVSAVGNYQTRTEYLRVEKNKKIRSVNLTVVGRMSESQCAALCVTFSDRCCEITYINSTQECKLDQSGCCHTDFDNLSGSSILHTSRKYVGYNKILSVTNGGYFGNWANEEFCRKGHYAVGYRMKIEGPHTDRSELNVIEIICGSRGSDRCGDTASSGQQVWGNWTGEALCPAKTFLTSFSLQVEKYNATKDSTGANYVRFRCRSFKDNLFDFDLSFPPGYGKYGAYGEWSDACPVNSAICGLKTKIQAAQGAGFDDTALNDVKFFCCE
ncbi:Vitelline membrane outer layer protein 1 homolog [Mytilus edulis]|uniref:Vitelline membrane outer layer protein 1 homolog n=2 Tax=Mytilus TaxID=6548 RepID=A0A8S3SUN7_MYTED|nr:Vitelline membrane outer layer protein 1 homolog [Mytilus edulis]